MLQARVVTRSPGRSRVLLCRLSYRRAAGGTRTPDLPIYSGEPEHAGPQRLRTILLSVQPSNWISPRWRTAHRLASAHAILPPNEARHAGDGEGDLAVLGRIDEALVDEVLRISTKVCRTRNDFGESLP